MENGIHQPDDHSAFADVDVIVGIVFDSLVETGHQTGVGGAVIELDAFQSGRLADYRAGTVFFNAEQGIVCNILG